MPHHRHHKIVRGIKNDNNNNTANEHELDNHAPAQTHGHNNNDTHAAQCCVPSGCLCPEETIDPSDPCDAVKVSCNNDLCTEGVWMHKICFDQWEDVVLAYLKSCGRARSWSEKQRIQNLWTKKGYDLAFKACDCKCGRGHIRKDLDYIPPPKVDNAKKHKKKPKKNDKPMPVVSTNKTVNGNGLNHNGNGNSLNHSCQPRGVDTVHVNQNANTNANANIANQNNNVQQSQRNVNEVATVDNKTTSANVLNGNVGSPVKTGSNKVWQTKDINDNNNGRVQTHSIPINNNINNNGLVRRRTDSLGSTSSGSSPPNSVGSCSPTSSPTGYGNALLNGIRTQRPKFDTYNESSLTQMNNMFRRRLDMSGFSILPRHKQNPYHIKMEDDGPTGNDETRSFVLSHLSSYKVTSLNCVLCKKNMPVFDRYPMVDGTFFLSPQPYSDGVVQVISEGRLQFINAVCVQCLEGGTDVNCMACKRKWDGSKLLLGSMYSYDIFAAMPCCQKRLTCKHCRRAVIDINCGLPFYSEYSRMVACPYCKAHDYHFIRPMSETFITKKPIWN